LKRAKEDKEARRERRRKKKEEQQKEQQKKQQQEEEDSKKLEEELKKENDERREKIVDEILDTEESYVAALTTCHDVFIEPLLKNRIIPEDTTRIIFSNLDTIILPTNAKFLKSLKKLISSWTSESKIANLMLETIPNLDSYSTYVINYNKSVEAFNKSLEIPEFEEFLGEAERDSRCNFLSLVDFLIMPVQRLPRYELLISDLMKKTDSTHPDYENLKEALGAMKKK